MPRKNIMLLLLLMSLAAVVLLAGCAKEPAENDGVDSSLTRIQEQGYFVVGLDDAFPPMGFREQGTNEIIGFDIDLAKAVAERMGVEAQFTPVIWDTIGDTLNKGDIDVIWNGCTITEPRLEIMNFTKPYLGNRQIIIVQKDSPITAKTDLAGKTIGLQAGSSAKIAVEKDAPTYESFGRLVEFTSNDEALLDLGAGRLDAVVVDEVVGRYYTTLKPDTYTVLTEDFGDEEYGVGVRKADEAFLAELNKTLDAMKEDGTAAQISEKWFGEDIIAR